MFIQIVKINGNQKVVKTVHIKFHEGLLHNKTFEIPATVLYFLIKSKTIKLPRVSLKEEIIGKSAKFMRIEGTMLGDEGELETVAIVWPRHGKDDMADGPPHAPAYQVFTRLLKVKIPITKNNLVETGTHCEEWRRIKNTQIVKDFMKEVLTLLKSL